MKKDKTAMQTIEFLEQSNAIEGVYSNIALKNAITAWDYLMSEKVLTHHIILKTHKLLMLNQPLMPHHRGYYRDIDVFIAGRKGADPKSIELAMNNWLKNMNDFGGEGMKDELKSDVSEYLHVMYEEVHPFVDGNGRTGRMFMNWWRIKHGLPLLIIHEGDEQQAYYAWFRRKI